MSKRLVELNLSERQVRDFIDWLANDTYWGHTWCADYEKDDTVFVINGHTVDTYSNQHHQLVIDNCYISIISSEHLMIRANGRDFTPIDFAMYKLGF